MRSINLAGCFLTGIFILACGLARTGIELIMFRAMQGIAISLCLPTSVAIIANAVPSGRKRNIAFSCLGFVQPIGFSMGMVLEGFIIDTIGWRFSYYLCGGLALALFAVNLWALPQDAVMEGSSLARLKKEIDWVGALMSSSFLAVFSYVLASVSMFPSTWRIQLLLTLNRTLSGAVSNIRHPASIALLVLSVALVPSFILWERRREALGLSALIPNSLWKNTVFTSVCLTVLLSNAVVNAMENYCSLLYGSSSFICYVFLQMF